MVSRVGGAKGRQPQLPLKEVQQMAKKDLAIINLTKAEAKAIDAKRIETELVPRLSLRHCKTYLVREVAAGAISVPETVVKAWTYGAVAIKGVDGGKVPGRKEAEETMTKAQYAKLDAAAKAALLKEHTTEKRAGYIVTALMTRVGLVPEAKDIVFLSNGRMAVDGIVLETARKATDFSALVYGVEINGVAVNE